MARINSNIPSLIAQSNLQRSQADLDVRLERLSTGLRINRGRDDPAGLIISERLRNDIRGVEQAIKNADRASSVIATTESALTEVNDLLNSIRALMVESANTGAFSEEEREANQAQIDSAIDSITRISNTARFGQLQVLNGGLDYQLSGVATSAVSNATVNNATFIGTGAIQVDVDVVASAQKAGLFFRGMPNDSGSIDEEINLEIAGPDGVNVFTFAAGTELSAIVRGINNQTGFTGVEAALNNPADHTSGMVFRSADYGAESFVSVLRQGYTGPLPDPFQLQKLDNNAEVPTGVPFNWANAALTGASRDTGQDVQALVNGVLARGNGLEVLVNSSGLGAELLLNEDFATDPTAADSTFYITGGGALFQIGPDITVQQQTNIGIPSVAASKLGGTLVGSSLQFLSSIKSGQGNSIAENVANGNDFTVAQDILTKSIDQIAELRGRLGAFERNVLQTSVNSMQTAFENLSASESRIRDADFAFETSALTRAQILTSSGTSVLGIANQQSQQVLQLLG
ncbi:MAG: flagellin [Planctomycetota bacterium]